MFPDEIERAMAQCPVAYLPMGVVEHHGPQNALGTDALVAHGVCLRTAERFGGVVAPPSWFNIGGDTCEISRNWWAHVGSPKTWGLFISPDAFRLLYTNLLRQMDLLGFKAVMAVAGHGGGPETDMRIIATHYMKRSPLRVCVLGWWEAMPERFGHVDHGGAIETSELWHLRPGLVDMARLPRDGSAAVVGATDCYQATPELGQQVTEAVVENLGSRAQQLLADYRPWPGYQVMPSAETLPFYEQVRRLEGDSLMRP